VAVVSTRDRIHAALLEAPQPMTVADLAAVIGAHRTVIAQHLDSLERAGRVIRRQRAPVGRGRPATVWLAGADDPYRSLAGWLASAAAAGIPPAEAGRRVGRTLVDGLVDSTEVVDRIEHEAVRIGFAPTRDRTDGDRITLRLDRCPFAELAAADLSVVCEVHLGLAEGMAAAAPTVQIDGLTIADPHRGGCVLHLRHVAG
jgi:predicted ArsR family transcriptional regulator